MSFFLWCESGSMYSSLLSPALRIVGHLSLSFPLFLVPTSYPSPFDCFASHWLSIRLLPLPSVMPRCVKVGLLMVGLFSCLFLIAELVRTFDPHAQRSFTTREPTFEGPSHLSYPLQSPPPPPHVSTFASFSHPEPHLPSRSLTSSSSPHPLPRQPSPASPSLIATPETVDATGAATVVPRPSASSPTTPTPSSRDEGVPMGSMHFESGLLSSTSWHGSPISPWWSRRLSPLHPLIPCPAISILNVTVQLVPSHLLPSQTSPPPSPPFHYTFILTAHTPNLDWVHLHLSLNSTAEGTGASDGSYTMNPHSRETAEMREAQWMWEHRVGGRLHGTEDADFAFSFHFNQSTCETDVTSTRISAISFPTHLLLSTAACSPHQHIEEEPHSTISLLKESMIPASSHDNAHPQDVEAAVLGLLAEATFDPHPHHEEEGREMMGGLEQQVRMEMDERGNMHVMPNSIYNSFSPHHMHSAHPHEPHAGVDPRVLYQAEQAVAFGGYGQRGAVGVGGAGRECAGDDWWCQVNAVCQSCFNYQQPALCSPCAAVLRCQDRQCAHHAVKTLIQPPC